MEYKKNINYSQKIREFIHMNDNELILLREKQEHLERLKRELQYIKEYSIEEMMPIFCKLIFEMENRKFRWRKEHLLNRNPYDSGYANLIDVIYLINEESDFDKYSFDRRFSSFICKGV